MNLSFFRSTMNSEFIMQKDHPNLNEKEWQYRSIFDAAIDGLIVHDLETGLVVEANPAACLMHGYTREEFIGLCNAPSRNESSNRKRFSLLILVYSTLLLLEV